MSAPTKIKGDELTVAAPSAGALPSSTPTPSGHQVLAGRYALLGLLGVGGMGSVYRARDNELDEIVALKVLGRDLVDSPGMLDRFRQEVRLARRVTHRNVARTFDIGEHAGERFLTMEFIDGESLGAKLAREPVLAMKEVVELASAICAGLGAAHAAGVVHRDLKPDNVLLGVDGRVAITDFGIARAVCVAAGALMTMGAPVGTPAYMAPEQVEGSQELDARVDVYALGTILYEMLTGERAWGGESVYAVAAARLSAPPPDPRARRADVSDAAAEVVLKCLARRRDDRFASVEDVVSALAGLTLSRPPVATKVAGLRVDAVLAEKTVAVLPFRNASSAEHEYMADGLTDDLIDSLSMTRGLKVRSRGAVMRFKGVDRDARDLGRELEVQVVVEGSVRKTADALRVTARLISVADGFQLWAKRFDGAEKDFLRISDEAANAIAQALTVARSAPAREPPTDAEAIDLYLRARHAYHVGWAVETERSIELFEKALQRAPNDPTILAGYALALLRRFGAETVAARAADAGDRGRRAAERALELAPHLGEARSALAGYKLLIGDSVGAAREVREAMRFAPGSGDVHDLYGRILVEVGRPEEGIASLRTAMMLEPTLFRARADVVRVQALLGDFTSSDTFADNPPSAPADLNTFWFYCARVATWRRDLAWTQKLERRIATMDFPLKSVVHPLLQSAALGEAHPATQATLADWGRVAGRAVRRPIFFLQLSAEVWARTGNFDAMCGAIEAAEQLGLIDVLWVDRCPLLAPYRAAPRFVAVRERVAVRAAEVLRALET